jgi:hypothetical protein
MRIGFLKARFFDFSNDEKDVLSLPGVTVRKGALMPVKSF